MFTRAVEPIIPQIATAFAIDVKTAALLSTAYTFPYALVQPVLGMIADFFGKTRLMNASLVIVAITALLSAITTDFHFLVALRVVSGLVAGGVFPVAMALVGDLVPPQQRQVAIGRLLAIALTGNLLGASVAGIIADFVDWRGVFFVLGAFGLTAAVVAYLAFRGIVVPKPKRFNIAAARDGFRSIFADPRAKVCFSAVFVEAVFIHGLFPYVAILLIAAGETRASIAGTMIACFGLGGVVYSISVPALVAAVSQRHLMIVGGAVAACALALIALEFPWQVQLFLFGLFGFGFYLLHGSIQVHVTELSDTARGLAASLHSCFFYLGQATGPVVYGYGFAHGGERATMLVGAVLVFMVGLVCSHLLRHRTRSQNPRGG